jgi:hypothetical protein
MSWWFMKNRGLTTSFALAGFLIASSVAAFADEPKLVPITTSLSSTVISGYVSVGAEYNQPAPPQHGAQVHTPTRPQHGGQNQSHAQSQDGWYWAFLGRWAPFFAGFGFHF